MKRRVLALLLASVAALTLMVGMVGSGLAASPFQPPLTALTKASVPTAIPLNTIVAYIVNFTTDTTGNVVIQDDLLHGLDLVGPGAVLDTTPVGPCISDPPVAPCIRKTASSPARQTYEFVLGTVPAGSHTLTFPGIVVQPFPKNQTYVKDTLNFYWGGQWKGKAEATTQLTPAP